MPFEFHCRNCGKALRAPDDAGGRRCRCPGCGAETTVPREDFAADSDAPYGVAEATKDCPCCGKCVKAAARKCRFCGTMLAGAATPEVVPVAGSHPLPPPAHVPASYPGSVVYGGRTSGLAIASLVLGLLGLCGIGSVLAIIFGGVAIKQINESNGQVKGKGMAVAGLVLGIVWLMLMVIWWALALGEGAYY